MLENNLFNSMDTFRETLNSMEYPEVPANTLNTIITQGLLHGQKQCEQPPKPPWSEALHMASLRVRFWQTILSERATGVSMTPATYAIGQEIWPNQLPQIPHCTKIIQKALKAYKRQLTTIRRRAMAKREGCLQELRARIAMRKITTNDQDKAIVSIEKQLRNTKNFKAIK